MIFSEILVKKRSFWPKTVVLTVLFFGQKSVFFWRGQFLDPFFWHFAPFWRLKWTHFWTIFGQKWWFLGSQILVPPTSTSSLQWVVTTSTLGPPKWTPLGLLDPFEPIFWACAFLSIPLTVFWVILIVAQDPPKRGPILTPKRGHFRVIHRGRHGVDMG